jgi:hypothetical protein
MVLVDEFITLCSQAQEPISASSLKVYRSSLNKLSTIGFFPDRTNLLDFICHPLDACEQLQHAGVSKKEAQAIFKVLRCCAERVIESGSDEAPLLTPEILYAIRNYNRDIIERFYPSPPSSPNQASPVLEAPPVHKESTEQKKVNDVDIALLQQQIAVLDQRTMVHSRQLQFLRDNFIHGKLLLEHFDQL